MKVNVENCIKNQDNLDIQLEVFTWFSGLELEVKLQYLLKKKIKSSEKQIAIMTEE